MPRLVASACMRDGKIVTGKRHKDCVTAAVWDHGWTTPVWDFELGFVDEDGKFYTRKEANKFAVENGQIPESQRGDSLLSEDLW